LGDHIIARSIQQLTREVVMVEEGVRAEGSLRKVSGMRRWLTVTILGQLWLTIFRLFKRYMAWLPRAHSGLTLYMKVIHTRWKNNSLILDFFQSPL
jgi:hypothetical protein